MPAYSAAIDIQAPIETVFDYVADLTKHSEWSADPLQVEVLFSGSATVGSQFRSIAKAQGKTIQATLTITEFQRPSRFSFTVSDLTGQYTHRFLLRAIDPQTTHLERAI